MVPASVDPPTFVLRLRPPPGIDAVKVLRLALKTLNRRFGLRCISLVQEDGDHKTENMDG